MTKDPDHKNRCRVLFPEVFSTFPYKVNVTAINALGTAHTNILFEESSIGEPKSYCWFLSEDFFRNAQKGQGYLKCNCGIVFWYNKTTVDRKTEYSIEPF